MAHPSPNHWEIQGRLRKRVVLANVPSFRFSLWGNMVPLLRSLFWGNIQMYSCSGFCSGGTSAKTTLLETHPFGNLRLNSVFSFAQKCFKTPGKIGKIKDKFRSRLLAIMLTFPPIPCCFILVCFRQSLASFGEGLAKNYLDFSRILI